MLTPIRVRGKNKRDQSRKLRRQALEQGAAIRPQGRPLKLVASSTSDPTTSSPSSRSSTTSRPSKTRRTQMKEGRLPEAKTKIPLSRLESLPVELLQSIFLYSLNVNLPLASPHLALALSNEHVYTRLILLAFSGICQGQGEEALYPDITSASLQTMLMSRRWFKFDLISKCNVLFAKEILERERSNPVWEITSDEPAEIRFGGYGDRQTSKRLYQLRRDHLSKRIEIFQGPITTSVRVAEGDSFRLYNFPLCATVSWVEQSEYVLLPEKLLHGPWTEEKLDLLVVLSSVGATVDWINTSLGEIAEQGLNDAIMEGNLRAVELLTQRPIDPSRETMYKNIWVKIDTRHARLAVLEAGCNLDIVEALVQHPDSTIDFNDKQIVAWAVKHNSEGDIRGRHLLDTFPD